MIKALEIAIEKLKLLPEDKQAYAAGVIEEIDGIRSFAVTPYSYVIYCAARNRELAVLHVRHGARAAPAAADFL